MRWWILHYVASVVSKTYYFVDDKCRWQSSIEEVESRTPLSIQEDQVDMDQNRLDLDEKLYQSAMHVTQNLESRFPRTLKTPIHVRI